MRTIFSRQNFSRIAVLAVACGTSAYGQPITKIVDTSFGAPGQNVNFSSVQLGGVDAVGTAFIGSFTVNSTNYSGLYNVDPSGGMHVLVDRSTPGPNGETINSIIGNGDYQNGMLVFAASTTAGQKLYRYTPGIGLQTLVTQGQVLPGSDAPIGTFITRGIAGDATGYAFSTNRPDGTAGLYVGVNDQPMVLADERTRSPIAETGHFQGFPEVSYRDGRIAYIGLGLDPDMPGATPEPAGVFLQTPGNPIQIIMGRNFLIPGTDDLRFIEFERPRVLPDGRVAFQGGFIDEENPTNSEHHLSILVQNPDLTWKKYIYSDMALPGLHADIQEFPSYAIEGGVTAFNVQDEDGGSYLYFESAEGVFTHLLDSYELLDGKQLSRLRLLPDSALDGAIAFRATFTDGSTGVYSAALPEPALLGTLAVTVIGLSRRRRA